jgi:hypothetical protein
MMTASRYEQIHLLLVSVSRLSQCESAEDCEEGYKPFLQFMIDTLLASMTNYVLARGRGKETVYGSVICCCLQQVIKQPLTSI